MNAVDGPPPERRPLLHRAAVRIKFGVTLGLLFLAGPIADLARSSLSPARVAVVAVALAVFVTVYWVLLPPADWLRVGGERRILVALALLPVLAIVVLAVGAPTSFVALFVYFVAAAGIVLPERVAVGVVGVTALGVGVAAVALGSNGSGVAAIVLTIVSIGILMAAFGRIARGNTALRAAREELARLAVSEERLRIARDLHDLLGHSLSVITLKSELAAKLVAHDSNRAAAELEDIQTVSRQALAEVREAVHGYRNLALADALDGARAALAAAGIDCRVEDDHVAVPEDVEAVFAWAVREGTTNVVRHSGAGRCEIRVHRNGSSAAVEVEDDGNRADASAHAGSGLTGLAERAKTVHGTLEAGSKRGGGFRLRLTVPLEAS